MTHPYRHPADVEGYTARSWSVTEWQKVYVRACQWLPWTAACRRWKAVQRRRERERLRQLLFSKGVLGPLQWAAAMTRLTDRK